MRIMAQILFVNLEGRIGGAETSLLLMVKHLRGQFVINVACPAMSPLLRSLASLQANCYELPELPNRSLSSIFSLSYWLKTNWRLLRIALRVKPDVIHTNSFYAAAASILAALVTRKKLIMHARDLADFGILSKFCNLFCEKVIAVSHAVENSLINQGVNPEKIRVVYNGVDNVFLEQSSENGISSSSTGLFEKSSFVFAHIAQFVPWKNHITFLKAATIVSRHLPDARFVLVGDDIFGRDSHYKSELLSYTKNSPILEKIRFLGWQDNMHEVWPNIDCLVHTAGREPFGRVIIEAMAHKIPVIAVDSCGPSEIIQNRKTGILVQAGDVKILSVAMIKIAQDTQFTDKLANAGYEHTMSGFTADKTAAQIQEVYTELLAV